MPRKYKGQYLVRRKPKRARTPMTRGSPPSFPGEAVVEAPTPVMAPCGVVVETDENQSVEPMETPQNVEESADDDENPDDSDPDDPTVASWEVYMTPEMQERLLLLQYPERSRTQPYNDASEQKPLELRIKPKTGMVEVDIPINIHANYDRQKGVQWGEAMRNSRVLKEGGTYGLAGGLGIGGVPKKDEDEMEEDAIPHDVLLANFEDANNKGHVLNKQTLGGQIVEPKDGDPLYMLGTFRGNEFHLSKLDWMVQLRPQFHHIDAMAEQEKLSSRAQRDSENPPVESEARAVNMTVKASESEELDMSQTAKILRARQEEKWTRLEYKDENDPESWNMYYDKMFLKDTKNAPELKSSMNNDEWLDSFSAPRIDPTRMGRKVLMTKPKPESSETSDDDESSQEEGDGDSDWEDEGEDEGEDGTMQAGDKDGDTEMLAVG